MRTKIWMSILGCLAGGMLATAVYAAATVTIADVIKMSEAGVNDAVIIQTLQSSGTVFQLKPQDVEALKRSGVSDRVVAAMQGRPQPVAPAPVPGPVQNNTPVVHEPSGRDYVGGVSEPVVRALPPDPPVYTYVAPPPTGYYYYPGYPYYYGPYPYYYGPRVGFYFGYGRWHRCR